MANFPPLKHYILFCIDRMIERFQLSQPFLDVGCGVGDASAHLAAKGWAGKAIDVSNAAFQEASRLLQKSPTVILRKQSLFEEERTFKTIFALDVLEHLEDDEAALEKIADLLEPGGALVATVPSNPREWRWDDDYVEHQRRYTVADFEGKLAKVALRSLVFWDFTYPVFWMMRRFYTRIKKSPPRDETNREARIETSGMVKMWEFPVISDLLSRRSFLWEAVYRWQFRYFKERLDRGHEMIVLARKDEESP